jgi:hypothetical protein
MKGLTLLNPDAELEDADKDASYWEAKYREEIFRTTEAMVIAIISKISLQRVASFWLFSSVLGWLLFLISLFVQLFWPCGLLSP